MPRDIFQLTLADGLKNRLNMIIQTIPEFWDKQPYKHFTNHGPAHSERIHNQKLAQLAQELPESRRLTNDEIFIVSAAARLYEIGMQSPKLKPTLDFEAEPDESLSFSQRQEIRANKHLLTERLIKGDYEGPPIQLGLTHPADSYTGLIATVCRWCSDDPLEDIPEILPINGIPIRVKLLAALLRLADQLYIHSSRIDLDLLERADLPMHQHVKWLSYNYAQTLPINNSKIPFYYFLPASQRQYLGYIRSVLEPKFERKNNAIIRYLWDEYQLLLIPDEKPIVQIDAQGVLQEMKFDVVHYLQQKISPIETSEEILQQLSAPSPTKKQKDIKPLQSISSIKIIDNQLGAATSVVSGVAGDEKLPFAENHNDCIFSISFKPEFHIDIQASGLFNLKSSTRQILIIDVEKYARRTKNAFRGFWRFEAKEIGEQLYNQLFEQYREVRSHYHQLVGRMWGKGALHLRFKADRNLLRIPIEFLYYEPEGHLVLKHPVARSITGITGNLTTLSPVFFNELYLNGKTLKVLLIASNTSPAIPKVDQEIEALSSFLLRIFQDKRIKIEVTMLPTEQATYETVKHKLKSCPYHIVHYAGHGTYDPESPEQSYLQFWENSNRQGGGVKELPISELQMLLKSSKTLRFFYLSCCVSAATGDPARLLDDDFLGIADGVIQAGIPAVLGFRWPVPDDGAKTLALAFYNSLARQGQVDTALLEARQEVASLDRDDRTWISPVLIMQE